MKIDLHNHVVPPTIVDAIAANPSRYGTKFELKDGRRYFSVHGPLAELKPEFYDVDAKVAWLDRVGLDVAVISVGPPIYFYGLSPEVGLEAARLANDGIAQMVARRPERLRGMDDYYLSNFVGFPLDTTLMVSHLMFSGALDELKQLRILCAHGGGYVPYQIGRFGRCDSGFDHTGARAGLRSYRQVAAGRRLGF
ncbi:MAG: hypothetical protein HY322_07275 [Betaproteobacteria bacterium]|nr:hypothetical protein [Betaproteobacteria bacterium]